MSGSCSASWVAGGVLSAAAGREVVSGLECAVRQHQCCCDFTLRNGAPLAAGTIEERLDVFLERKRAAGCLLGGVKQEQQGGEAGESDASMSTLVSLPCWLTW